LKAALWKAAKNAVEEWTQQEVSPISLYGIRISTTGAILAPHVDRLPLVTSVIVNVAQDVEDHWPLEVIGHDGYAHNITLEIGEMLLYESHSIIHGRPFPLKGKYMANLYLHFEPTGHSWKHHEFNHDESATPLQYREAVQKGAGGHEAAEHPSEHSMSLDHDTDLPIYLIPNSPEVKHYRKLQQKKENQLDNHPAASSDGAEKANTNTNFVPTDAHALARDGKVEELYTLLEEGGDHLVHAKDHNGWQPLHESARAGHLTVVQLLVAKGAGINERTHEGAGGTPLYYASTSHGEESLVAKFLQSHGAVSIAPIDEL
jgi:prolyl 4-hydroxylase